MIKILHIVGILNKGGIETLILNIARAIDRDRFQIDVLCTIPGIGEYEEEFKKAGSSIYKIGNSFCSYKGKTRFIEQYNTYLKWFNMHSYDIIHINGSHAFDTAIAVKAALSSKSCNRVVVHSHNASGDHPNLNRIASRYLASAQVKRIACSESAAKWMFGSRASDVTILNNGIDIAKFQFNFQARCRLRRELNVANDEVFLLNVARLAKQKNQKFLIELMRLLDRDGRRQCKLAIVGEGPEKTKLENLSKSFKLNNIIIFLGSRSDIPELLSAADVFVLPSLYEGLGIAAIEAQAAGLPTLLSNFVPPEADVSPLARHLPIDATEVWASEISSIEIGENSRGDANDLVFRSGYDIHNTVNKLIEIYIDILTKKQYR